MRRQETPRDVVENCPIDRLSIFDIDPVSFHQNYRLESKPLIITDVLQNIPEWTLELLEREAGQLSFPVRCYGAG
ncbi:MAG: hypothetical protein MI864_15655, partial [Pseudomonadales bacterium]|nr:hypothetical protein [Pseudomonadales bacterium]